MPKLTVSQLESRVAQLELFIKRNVKAVAPKGACHVFLGSRKQPYLTALSHSAAFKFMTEAKAAGIHAHYRPVAA